MKATLWKDSLGCHHWSINSVVSVFKKVWLSQSHSLFSAQASPSKLLLFLQLPLPPDVFLQIVIVRCSSRYHCLLQTLLVLLLMNLPNDASLTYSFFVAFFALNAAVVHADSAATESLLATLSNNPTNVLQECSRRNCTAIFSFRSSAT